MLKSLILKPFMDNGPFAGYGHMVQNPPYWMASYTLGQQKQRKFKHDWMKSLCFVCPSA